MNHDVRDRVLNPRLYLNLLAAYGQVRVQHLGMGAKKPRWQKSPLTGRVQLEFDKRFSRGEYYRLKCPFCPKQDGRFVVYVHHLYGQLIDERPAFGLVRCFRCNFESDPVYASMFRDSALSGLSSSRMEVKRGRIEQVTLYESKWPGTMCSLSSLPDSHPAKRFFEARRFDLEKHEKLYGLKYCVNVTDSQLTLAAGRIIIPIFRDGKMIGWQARAPGLSKAQISGPSYYTKPNFPTDHTFYNHDSMRRFRTGIVVEGVTDVWALGGCAGALFGSMVHPPQLQILLDDFADYSVVFLLDPDVKKDVAKYAALTTAHRECQIKLAGGAALVWLPGNKDPGDYPEHRQWLLNYVKNEAAKQGVEVRYAVR